MGQDLPKGVRPENKSYIKWLENQKKREPWELKRASGPAKDIAPKQYKV